MIFLQTIICKNLQWVATSDKDTAMYCDEQVILNTSGSLDDKTLVWLLCDLFLSLSIKPAIKPCQLVEQVTYCVYGPQLQAEAQNHTDQICCLLKLFMTSYCWHLGPTTFPQRSNNFHLLFLQQGPFFLTPLLVYTKKKNK